MAAPFDLDLAKRLHRLADPASDERAALETHLGMRSFAAFFRMAWRYIDPAHLLWNWHIDLLCAEMEKVARRQVTEAVFCIPPRMGKLVAHDEPVLTALGWKSHGDLAVGDVVFGPDGLPTTVIALSPDGVANMEVEISDGATVRVHERHEWTVFDRSTREWRTLETRAIAERLEAASYQDRSAFMLPQRGALQMPEQPLPIPPYVLGAWLGDGTSAKACFTHSPDDEAVIEAIVAAGFPITSRHVHASTGVITTYVAGLRTRLRKAGLLGQKRIPATYLLSSERQRLELLAGIIDTDGAVGSDKRVHITNANPALIDGLEELIRGLGWRVSRHWVEPRLSSSGIQGRQRVCDLAFTPDRAIPTRLKRKLIEARPGCIRKLGIRRVRPCNPVPGRCIQVDRADGLYLVGRTLVPTHNSQIMSVAFPAWVWTWFPSAKFITGSNEMTLATRDAVAMRRLVKSAWYQRRWGPGSPFLKGVMLSTGEPHPGVAIHGDQDNKTYFETTAGGHRFCCTPGSNVTGHGGDFVLCDDPHPAQRAESEAERNAVLSWWWEAIPTRLNEQDRGVKMIIQQRVHRLDLAGSAIDRGYYHVVLPMEFEPDHPHRFGGDRRTEKGELLHPDRVGPSGLAKLKRALREYGTAGQLQQRPVPREGGLFKRGWLPVVDAVPAECWQGGVRRWDLAATVPEPGKDPDWTAGVRMAKDGIGRTYILHCERFRASPAQVDQAIKAIASQDGMGVQIGIPQDPGQAGVAQAQALARFLAPYAVTALRESGKKEDRARGFAAQCEMGNVFLLRGKWNEAFIEELCEFPNGAHDDQLDAATGAFDMLHSGSTGLLDYYRLMAEA